MSFKQHYSFLNRKECILSGYHGYKLGLRDLRGLFYQTMCQKGPKKLSFIVKKTFTLIQLRKFSIKAIILISLHYFQTCFKDRNAKLWPKTGDLGSDPRLLYGLTILPHIVPEGLLDFGSLSWKNRCIERLFPYQKFILYDFKYNQ